MFVRVFLYLLVGFGFFGSGRLAWREWSTGEACPVVGSVPACYVAFAGFVAMVIGLVAFPGYSWSRNVFYLGVTVAGGLAFLGSGLEFAKGNVCPRAGSIPMCYISLAMSVVIVMLFLRIASK